MVEIATNPTRKLTDLCRGDGDPSRRPAIDDFLSINRLAVAPREPVTTYRRTLDVG